VTDFAEETFKIHVNGSFSGRLGYYPTGLNSVSGYIFPTGGYTSYLNAGTRYVNFSGTDSVITLTDLPPGVNYHYFIEPTETDFPDISGNSQCYDVSDDFSTNDLGSGTPHVPVKPIVWGPDHAVYDVCDNNYQFDLTDDLYNAPYNRILKFPDIARVQMTYGIYSKDILVGTAQGDVLAYSRPPGYGQGLRYIVPAPLDHSHSYKGLGYDFTLTNGAIYHMDYGTPPNYTNVKYASPYAPDHCPISNVINVLTVTSQSDSTATLSYSLPSPVTNSIAIPAPSTAIPTDASGTEIQYGLSSTELNQNYITPKPTTTAQTVIIPNLKTRTYYYRIVYSDKANNKFYSQIYTLKHGNKYIRFVNDLVGNSWDWARKLVKK
jgi:hypothetical protein